MVDEIQLKGEAYFPIDCGDFVCLFFDQEFLGVFIHYLFLSTIATDFLAVSTK